MYTVQWSGKFKKDIKRYEKQPKKIKKFKEIALLLEQGKPLPHTNRDHRLTGNWSGFRECHITPDFLLIYKLEEETKTITFARMGSHSELFG
jgi:mRNA interferase YafQ